jgi:dihydrofolate synthase/folylpolyglutamate synthase
VNGQLISEREMVDLCQEVFEIVENSKLDIRFFEIITILGFLIFNRAKCDFVCLEVGLGGKLDATNVVEGEDVICSAIVSLGMDHMDVIGDTIEDIAEEKCGIIKVGTPVVLGPTCQNLEPVKKALETSGSPFV